MTRAKSVVPSGKPVQESGVARQQRLAEQLRVNLLKRKALVRQRAVTEADGCEDGGGDGFSGGNTPRSSP